MKIKKVAAAAIVLFLQLTVIGSVCAQGLGTPCNGGDPDVDCPIDNEILLFGAIVIYACFKLRPTKTAKGQLLAKQ